MAKEPERQYRKDDSDRSVNEEVKKQDQGSHRPDHDSNREDANDDGGN